MEKWKNMTVKVLSIGIVLVSILFLTIIPINLHLLRAFHMAAVAIIILLVKPLRVFKGKLSFLNTAWDTVLIIGIILSTIYYCQDPSGLVTRARIAPLPLDIILAVVTVVVVLEISRRTVGNVIVGIALFMIAYCLFGYLIPTWVGCPKFNFGQVICYFYSYEGIYGIPMQTSASYILLFVVFSAFLNLSGAAKAFIDLSLAACNKMVGGAAKLTILVNTLMGMVSGTPIANVVTTGPFCIPLMQKSGMRGVDASAMTAAAAVGSQIIPPVMGAAAFIMVEYIGVSYLNLIWIALIPALLYMFSIVVAANCTARRYNMKPVDMTDVPSPKQIFKEQWNVLVSPLVLLFMIIVVGSSLSKAVVYAMIACIVMSWFNKKKEYRLGIKEILKGMEDGVKDIYSIVSICGAAGIVIGALSLSGFGLKFSMMLVSLSGGVIFFALLLCCVLVILLGMGLPPSAVYLIPAIMVAPALVNMGVNKIAAHMFIFYFSCFAPLTPPVAMAAYTAAPFSNSNPNQVGFVSAKIALAGFVIPFVFALQPCMLFQGGTVLESVIAVIAAAAGTYAFASGINGWYFGRTNVPIAAGLIVGGLLLIWPGLITDLTGIAIIVALYFVQKVRHRGGRGDEIEVANDAPAVEKEK